MSSPGRLLAVPSSISNELSLDAGLGGMGFVDAWIGPCLRRQPCFLLLGPYLCPCDDFFNLCFNFLTWNILPPHLRSPSGAVLITYQDW